MDIITLSKPDKTLRGTLLLDGSKSISNRALIVQALSGQALGGPGLSDSKDTRTLYRLLQQTENEYDAGDAGTTFRFMTAYLAMQPGTQVLTGSARMRERPIGALVEALRALGANIQFLEKDGYPPLRIGALQHTGQHRISIPADVSSQFLSALAMIGPYLPEGLELVPEGRLVSRPYLEMTLQLMRYFGAEVVWEGESVRIAPGGYQTRDFVVEADWSAASYWYAFAAFAEEVDLKLEGLLADSWQGDAVLPKMMEAFGVHTEFEENGIRLSKNGKTPRPIFEWDFIECPDIAQTLAVVCAGLGVQGVFTGLETLSIKETDRIAALKAELSKIGTSFSKLPARFSKKHPEKTYYMVSDQAKWTDPPQFATYGDHRMAMAFAPLAILGAVQVMEPGVVVKSYGGFWEDLRAVGVVADFVDSE